MNDNETSEIKEVALPEEVAATKESLDVAAAAAEPDPGEALEQNYLAARREVLEKEKLQRESREKTHAVEKEYNAAAKRLEQADEALRTHHRATILG